MKKTFLFFGAIFAFALCNAQHEPQNTKKTLEGFIKSSNDVWYKFEKHNENGKQVKEGDIIIGQASISLGDSITMDGFMYPSQPIFKATMQQNVFKGDLMEGLFLMKTGEICTFAFPHDSIAKAMPGLPPFFKENEYAYFKVKIDSTATEEDMRIADSLHSVEEAKLADSLEKLEDAAIEKYLTDNGFDKTKINGVYIKHIKEGSGEKPVENDNVKVHYAGRFLDGRLFDTSIDSVAKAANKYQQGRNYEPLQFGIGRHQMIEGFENGVKTMREGGKAIVVIPSALAYGRIQRGEIPPCSPLTFELELVKVEKTPATTPIKVEPANKNTPKTAKTTSK
ncbi:MAG: FKBP-type peptidyl-prolyl cis-trans isomerase [Bacteroidales bacterium]|jgi:FKBP-type peptidyl-prolyl cis-trans isomerase|nr:FKBP-type peptidyl-prolyl cis-trans isomerase [Bacteroidales bacterium]